MGKKRDQVDLKRKLFWGGQFLVLSFFLFKVGCGPGVRYGSDPTSQVSPSPSPSPSPSVCTPDALGPKSAVSLDGTTGYVSVTHAPFSVGPGFTMEFWMKFPASGGDRRILNLQTGNPNDSVVYLNASHFLNASLPTTSCNGAPMTVTSGSALLVDTNYHIAIVRDSTNLYLSVNGALQSTVGIGNIVCQSTSTWVGQNLAGGNFMNGTIDQVRISDIARYTGPFTPPIVRFCPDANTLVLLNFDYPSTVVDYPAGSAFSLQGAGATLILSPFY